ncbi:hypothetical protein [Lelliottia steviae]|uniref:hypothetical protein n=1 Tax=Pseudoalteromonas sp. PB2-1 TaxID=2907242 RepID=UPI00187F463C|nr:hypothetical protein [Lelliottia steviae]|tara:strand:- start:7847 stop:8050 length:204 start_codon:yes stop_codon:yes gene_type:complete
MSFLNLFKSRTETEKAVDKVLSEMNKNELKVDMIGTEIFRINMNSLRKSEVVQAQLKAATNSTQVTS